MDYAPQMVFQTRFSYFGQSGWRSSVSKDKAALLDPERLDKRLEIFEKITLASLQDQSDPRFKLVLLTSEDLPATQDKRLEALCNDTLGADRVHLLRRGPGSAGLWLRRFTRNKLAAAEHSAQIVLDDDDAVSIDFVERCRAEAAHSLAQFRPDQICCYLSFANGLTGLFHSDGGLDLIPREVPFTNLGLTLVGPTSIRKNPYMLAHKKVARRHDVRVFHERRPFYIRSLHGLNDSRAHHRDTTLDAAAVEDAKKWFPLLDRLDLVALRPAPDRAIP